MGGHIFTVIKDQSGKKWFEDDEKKLHASISAVDFVSTDILAYDENVVIHKSGVQYTLTIHPCSGYRTTEPTAVFRGEEYFQTNFKHLTAAKEIFASWLDEGDFVMILSRAKA